MALKNPMSLTLLEKIPNIQSDMTSTDPWSQLCMSRGCDDEFFRTKTLDDLHDAFLMPDMQVFCTRIKQAQTNKERVMIFGDYDVDGISSTAALFLFLRDHMSISVSYRLPDRHKDWYGLKDYFIDEIHATGTTLLITVDCGIRDIDTVSYAKGLWLDVLITDHHSVWEMIPDTIAVVNPARKDSKYPLKELSWSGVVLKCIQALTHGWEHQASILQTYIDIVTLGIIADCMPLVDENRTISQIWLKQMLRSEHIALKRLAADKNPHTMDGDFVGFYAGPMINASGRMESPHTWLKMLLARDIHTAKSYIEKLENLNAQRKELTRTYSELALREIDDRAVIGFFDHEEISHGLIGLIAGRVTQDRNIPSIVFGYDGDILVGSCRSPEHISIINALDSCKDLLLRYGGHTCAAGCSIQKKDYPEFRKRMEKFVSTHTKNIDTTPKIVIDQPLQERYVCDAFFDKIQTMRPFWRENEKPVFLFKNVAIESVQFLWADGKHIKIISREGSTFLGFFFGDKKEIIQRAKYIDIIGTLEQNIWRNTRTIQVYMQDAILRYQ